MRIVPRVRLINFRKLYPDHYRAFSRWFSVRRYWHGKILVISVKYFTVSFDFRRDWLADMAGK